MSNPRVGILHFTAPPVVGGVEAVIEAHARIISAAGYPVTIIAGRGDVSALPAGVELALLPEMDTQHPRVLEIAASLQSDDWQNEGNLSVQYSRLRGHITESLRSIFGSLDIVVIHNVLTKHFNMPLTSALFDLLREGSIPGPVSWVHDMSWTSAHSRPMLHPGMPWDLLRTWPPGAELVTISMERREELAGLLEIPQDEIHLIPNGVDPQAWWGVSPEGWKLVEKLDLLSAGLVLLMPVRLTHAKNIELAAQVTAELKKRGFNPRLVITGPPDPHEEGSQAYYEALLAMRSEMGLDNELRFVYETAGEISVEMVSDLMRASDVLFLPSHREGFGMPVLEAGLTGVPVISSRAVPAAVETGGEDAVLFDPLAPPGSIADLVLDRVESSPTGRFKRRVRQQYTWDAIFREQIEPLMEILVRKEIE